MLFSNPFFHKNEKNLIRGNNKKSYKTLLFPFTSEFLWCPNIAAYLMSMTERFNHSFVKKYLWIRKPTI